jgi:FixJ family two-component response regulator
MPDVSPLIAIVDDDLSVRRSLQRLLRSFGLQAQTFPSGEGLLEALASFQTFDCAVMDVQMRGINGLEVQRRLAFQGLALPLVFITAHDEEGIAEIAIAAGAVGFLRKPFTDQSLMDLIRLALEP